MVTRYFLRPLLASAMLICALSRPAAADLISFTLSQSTIVSSSGGHAIFAGTVTNNSGVDLNASDFFFNFFGYDPAAVTPSQVLGLNDFGIPKGTTSATVDLFDVLFGSVPDGASFPIQVQLEDVNNNTSGIQTVTVSTSPSSPVPEPATLFLTGIGLSGMLFSRRHARSRR